VCGRALNGKVAASYTWAEDRDMPEPMPPPLTRDEIVRRLADTPPIEDLLTADDLEKQRVAASAGDLTPAAVLLLVVNRPGEPVVVFTQRTAHLADHAGQISFPGGGWRRATRARCTPRSGGARGSGHRPGARRDPGRASRLPHLDRLPRAPHRRLGRAAGGVRARPVRGRRRLRGAARLPPRDRNHRYESAFYKGRLRHYWAMPWQGRFIWGATAGMLVTFQRIVGR